MVSAFRICHALCGWRSVGNCADGSDGDSSMMFFGVGALAAAALAAGWYFGGVRGLALAAALIALAWVAERIDASWRAEAALAQANADLADAQSAFQEFQAASERAATAAATKIAAIEAARADAETALAEHRQRSAKEFEALKTRIQANVPARPQCDYPQSVVDGLRDAHRRAAE